MGFSLSERYVTVLNLLLIAALAYLAAQTVNQVFAWRLSGDVTVQPLPPPRPPPPERSLPRTHYDLIVSRDIFNAPAVAPSVPVVEDLHLKLLGTSMVKHSKPYAILEDERTGKQSLYKLGEEIPDAGKLAEVEKERVIVEYQGRRIAVEMPSAPTPEPIRRTFRGLLPGVGGPHSAVRRMAGNRFLVDRSTVEQSLSNMGDLLTQMRATPNVDNGRTDGFKISEVAPGSLFQQMGLTDGDVIQSINGRTLDDPARAIDMLRTLSDQQSVTISLLRGGTPVQFQYELR
ncbi:MAG: type II secretion system protein GspC [Candidatus Binataceae bacterium]